MGQDSAPIHSLVFGFGHRARHGKDTVAKAIIDARSLGTAVSFGIPEGDFGRGTAVLDASRYNIRSYSFAKELKDEVNQLFENLRMPAVDENYPITWARVFDHCRYTGVLLTDNHSRIKIPDWVMMEPDPDLNDPLCPYGKYRTLLQWWGSEYRRINFGDNYWVERAAARVAADKPEIAFFTDMRFPNEMAFVKEHGLAIKVQRPGLESPNAHISEEALAHVPDSEWDAIITNDGTLEEIKVKAVQVFDELMSRQR